MSWNPVLSYKNRRVSLPDPTSNTWNSGEAPKPSCLASDENLIRPIPFRICSPVQNRAWPAFTSQTRTSHALEALALTAKAARLPPGATASHNRFVPGREYLGLSVNVRVSQMLNVPLVNTVSKWCPSGERL